MLSPVSPSATGNTLRSLTSRRRSSRYALAALTTRRNLSIEGSGIRGIARSQDRLRDRMGEASREKEAAPGTGPAPVLPVVRAGLWLLFVLAIANGAFLYFFPSRAEPDYAWAIAPALNAAFIGAGYLAGAVTTGLGVFSTRHWRSLRPLVPGFCALGILLFAATLIHEDRFRWDYALTWLWTVIYAGLPIVACILLRMQDKVPAERPVRDANLGPRWIPAAAGALLVAAAGILFIAPDSVLEEWPWPLTPLLSRVFAGWYALAGITMLFTAATAARAHEAVNPFATVAAWSLLVLSVLPTYSEDVSSDAGLFWPFIAFQVFVLAVAGWTAAQAASAMKAAGEEM